MVESLINRKRNHFLEDTIKEFTLLKSKDWYKAALALSLSSGRTKLTIHGKYTFAAATRNDLIITSPTGKVQRIPLIIKSADWVDLYHLLPTDVKQLEPAAVGALDYDSQLADIYEKLDIYKESSITDYYLEYALNYSSYHNTSEFIHSIVDPNPPSTKSLSTNPLDVALGGFYQANKTEVTTPTETNNSDVSELLNLQTPTPSLQNDKKAPPFDEATFTDIGETKVNKFRSKKLSDAAELN